MLAKYGIRSGVVRAAVLAFAMILLWMGKAKAQPALVPPATDTGSPAPAETVQPTSPMPPANPSPPTPPPPPSNYRSPLAPSATLNSTPSNNSPAPNSAILPPPPGANLPGSSPSAGLNFTTPTQPSVIGLPPAPSSFGPDPLARLVPAPTWSITAEALWLQRSTNNFGSLGETILFNTETVVDQLNIGTFAMTPGMRLRGTYRADDLRSFEAIYFGLQHWSLNGTIYGNPSHSAFHGNGPIWATSPYTQADFLVGPFAGSLGYAYSSNLNNAELNRRFIRLETDNWTVDTLLGVRFLEWSERFNLTGINAPNTFNPFSYSENLEAKTYNSMVGAQIGFGLRHDWVRLSTLFNTKAALMGNFVYQSFSNANSSLYLSGFPGFVPAYDKSSTFALASILDFSAIANYQFTPSFSLRGGYQLLYVSGLALAPAQLRTFDNFNGVLLHGPSAGLTYQW